MTNVQTKQILDNSICSSSTEVHYRSFMKKIVMKSEEILSNIKIRRSVRNSCFKFAQNCSSELHKVEIAPKLADLEEIPMSPILNIIRARQTVVWGKFIDLGDNRSGVGVLYIAISNHMLEHASDAPTMLCG